VSELAKTYVVDGAKLKCSCGTTTCNLKVANDHKASIGGKLQANIKDSRPNANVKSFGPCGNRPKRRTCDLKITGQWTSGKNDLNVGGAPALLNSSKLRCNRGGIISIVDPGQKLDQTGAAPIKIRKKNKDNPYIINASWYGQADKKTGEIYAVAESGGTICGLGKAIYHSEQAGYEIAKLNSIKNPDKIQVGQRVKLKALKGYYNDNYIQMMIGSFLIGELSYKDIRKNHITYDMFSIEDKRFIKKYIKHIEWLYKTGKIDEKKRESEIKRIDGEIYDLALGNIQSHTVKVTKDSYEVSTFDGKFLADIIGIKLLGCLFEHKWIINPEANVKFKYKKDSDDVKRTSLKTKIVDVSLAAELYLYEGKGTFSLDSLELSGSLKYGIGASAKFSMDEQLKPTMKLSGAIGFGFEIGIKFK
jgi:hypothetical protein